MLIILHFKKENMTLHVTRAIMLPKNKKYTIMPTWSQIIIVRGPNPDLLKSELLHAQFLFQIYKGEKSRIYYINLWLNLNTKVKAWWPLLISRSTMLDESQMKSIHWLLCSNSIQYNRIITCIKHIHPSQLLCLLLCECISWRSAQ